MANPVETIRLLDEKGWLTHADVAIGQVQQGEMPVLDELSYAPDVRIMAQLAINRAFCNKIRKGDISWEK